MDLTKGHPSSIVNHREKLFIAVEQNPFNCENRHFGSCRGSPEAASIRLDSAQSTRKYTHINPCAGSVADGMESDQAGGGIPSWVRTQPAAIR